MKNLVPPQTLNTRPTILLTSRSGQLGGMELRLADEARLLSDIGYDCLLAPSKFPGRTPWIESLLKERSEFKVFEYNPPPFFEQWAWRKTNLALAHALWLPRLKRAKIDIAHVFYAWTQEGGSRLWLCHKARIPAILSIHNAFPKTELSSWHAKITEDSFSSVRGLYAVSQSALDNFMAIYGNYVRDNTAVAVIPNFVDTHRFTPSDSIREKGRNALGIPKWGMVIGSIGRIDTQKQPLSILNVFDNIWTRRKDVYLLFCGQGPLESKVRKLVESKPWADRVHFLGFRTDTENVFPMLDVHLLISKQEGFGITTAEAMACGVPVVATDVPGSRDVIGKSSGGSLVPFGNIELISSAVERFIESPELRSIASKQGRRRVDDFFSKEIWKEKITRFYNTTL